MESPRTPPELNLDAVTEVLLRVPPDDPARLVRASAVCSIWRRILAGPAFRVRYRALHGAAPQVLGFLHDPADRQLPRFVPTASFHPAAADQLNWYPLDCRHGRALLYNCGSGSRGGFSGFVVWDPITGPQQRMPDNVGDVYMHFAVVCADTGGCDHTACGGGPVLLACAGVDREYDRAHACFFSFETGDQSVPIYIQCDGCRLEDRPAALVGDSLYFVGKSGILLQYRYDLLLRLGHRNILKAGIYSTDVLSVIKPPGAKGLGNVFVMATEDGGLGLASLHLHKLSLWARETGPDGGAGWVQRRTIDLKMLLPAGNPKRRPCLSGVAEGANVIFVSTEDGVFTIELESLQARKVCEMGKVEQIYPFVTFYTETLLQKLASGKLPAPAEDQ